VDFFALKEIGFLSPGIQIALIAILFGIAVVQQYGPSRKTGKMYSVYPVSASPLLAPIFEEIIFRGIILTALLGLYSIPASIIVSSLLFGLWHLKNIFWEGKKGVIRQMAYAGLVIGPILAILTVWTGTIWLAVIVHYLNNIWSPLSKDLYKKWSNSIK